MTPTLRRLFHLPSQLYRWNCGWVLGRRFLLLTHTGRRSGLRHHTVLEVMDDRRATGELIVMSAFGRDAGWLRNIQATPRFTITIGSQSFPACFRQLEAAEAIDVVAAYERRNRFAAPVIRAVLSRLLGWQYDGSAQARSRLVEQLPLIAFRAAPPEPSSPHPVPDPG